MSQQQPEAYVLPPVARARASVLGLRDFRLLWIGQTVSAVGDQIFPIAVALKIITSGGRPADLGLVLMGRSLGMVLFLTVGGVYADRLPRTRIMIGSDLLRFVAVAGLAMTPGDVPLWVLVALTFGVGGGEAFFRPAYGAVVPSVVPKDRLTNANALTSVSLKTSMLLGPALGAAVVGIGGARWALGIDAATFLVSMLTLLRIAEPPLAARGERKSGIHEALEGVRAVRERPWVAAILVMATLHLMLAVAPMVVLQPFIAVERLGGRSAYAAIVTVYAAGGLVGALLCTRFKPRHPGLWALAGLLPHTPLLIALGYSRSFWLVAGLSFVSGIGLEPFQIWWSSALQREIPPELLARVISLDWLMSLGLLPVGQALAGPAAEAFGRPAVMAVAAGVMLVTSIAVMPVPGVAEFRTPPGPPSYRPRLRPASARPKP
ncbi:MAG TPA: MFS transporter [Frankiaceae bacterium]|nr:MFS transporter [Frankiaceae bacterium]